VIIGCILVIDRHNRGNSNKGKQMSEEQTQKEEQNEESKRTLATDADWNTDLFPTSAKPIYRKVALLASAVIVSCFYLYYSSDHPAQDEKELKRLEMEEDYLDDDPF